MLETPSVPQSSYSSPRHRVFIYCIHGALLLFAIAAGAALIYTIQPPKPAPGSLLYEMHIFTSDQRVEDFTPHVQMLQYNAAQGVRWLNGGDMVGNIHFASEPGMLTRFNLALPSSVGQYQTLTGMQFEIRGDPVRDRMRLGLSIETNYTVAAHRLEMAEGEYRVVEVLTGKKDRQKWCYAIIHVQSAKIMAATALAKPQPPIVPIRKPTE